MTCSDAALVDYWTADLAPQREREVEEHVFACDRCARWLAGIEALATAIRGRVALGKVRHAVPASLVEALAAHGLRIRTFHLRRGEAVPCGAAPEDELLVGRITLEPGGADRVDLLVCDDLWAERERHPDVPVDRTRGELVITERVDVARSGAPYVLRMRVVAVDAAGERELGRFALAHDPHGPPDRA